MIDEKVYEQRITLMDLETDRLAQITPADMYVYEYDWAPDGQSFAASAAQGAGDANWYVARLYFVNAKTGEMRELYKPKLQIAEPRVSFDGKNVAFIEGLMSDEGSTGGDIHVVSIAGGPARNLTPGITSSPSALAGRPPSALHSRKTSMGIPASPASALKAAARRLCGRERIRCTVRRRMGYGPRLQWRETNNRRRASIGKHSARDLGGPNRRVDEAYRPKFRNQTGMGRDT